MAFPPAFLLQGQSKLCEGRYAGLFGVHLMANQESPKNHYTASTPSGRRLKLLKHGKPRIPARTRWVWGLSDVYALPGARPPDFTGSSCAQGHMWPESSPPSPHTENGTYPCF